MLSAAAEAFAGPAALHPGPFSPCKSMASRGRRWVAARAARSRRGCLACPARGGVDWRHDGRATRHGPAGPVRLSRKMRLTVGPAWWDRGMALETSAESPVPVRTVLQLVSGWIGKLGRV